MNTETLRTLVNAHIQSAYGLRDMVKAQLEDSRARVDAINDEYREKWATITADERAMVQAIYDERDLLMKMDWAIGTAGQGNMELI